MLKKLFAVLMALLMVFSLVGCSSTKADITKEENKGQGQYAGKTIILHTNDVHGGFSDLSEDDAGLEGYAAISSMKKHFEAKGATVILVDNGDYSQGSIYVSLNKGAAATDLMEKAGYDIVGLGNHEFDYGVESLKSIHEGKSYKVICANVFDGDKTLFDADCVVQVGDLKIGFFGMLTPETQTKVNPNYVKDLTFTNGQELFDVAQAEIDSLKKKSDLVICLGHLGVDAESIGHTSEDLYANTTGLDFIIDGHSHTQMSEGSHGEPIQSAGTKSAYIGVIIIDTATKKIERNLILPLINMDADEEVLDAAMGYMKQIDEDYGAVFASTEVTLVGEKALVRSQETNLGDLITDAMIWEVLKAGSIEVPDENLIAVTNGGGIRASIQATGVTMKDINTVLPFGNTLAVDYCTGAELLEALEASTYAVPDTLGGFPQVAGIQFTVYSSRPFDAAELYPDSTYYKPGAIQRVKINSINGKPFDENATYAIVTNNFMAAGGDTYYAFKKAYDEGRGFDTGMVLDEVVIDYVTNELGGKIGAQYAEPQGRIIIK